MKTNAADSLRIAVTGLAATFPFGGVFWDYLQYPLGLQRLGHEVLYIEDTGQWSYDPRQATFSESGSHNAELLARAIQKLDQSLANRWHFRDATGKTFGRTKEDVAAFCRSADLFLNISASCWMRDEYLAAKRLVFIDSDPMYTQASIPDYLAGTIADVDRRRVEGLLQHDVFFTFAENIGAPDCRVPSNLIDWLPTRQPIVLDCFSTHTVPLARRRRTLTTVASWEPSQRPLVVDGERYLGKSAEFERYIDLPAQSSLPLEVALNGPAPIKTMLGHGWQLADPNSVSADPWTYRNYLAHSHGEWSVAKHAYVAGKTGWFSCRTACYLALGVPAVVQDTGFSRYIPTGEGVIAFDSLDEAADGIARIAREPVRHAKAACAVASEYFDSDKVLTQLVERAMQAPRRPAVETSGG